MKLWIVRFASLKVAVSILAVMMVALSVGTIIESTKTRDQALIAVYESGWFRALMAVFVLNVLASIAIHWPWGKRRVGFLLTHSSLILILVGGAVTTLFKTEGQLFLWEGESSARVEAPPPEGSSAAGPTFDLPFAVKLEAFEIDYYPGTRRPAMFRSRVVVEDKAAGRTVPAVIQMNQELAYGGYRFFQSSYRQEPNREATILSVSKDPGQPIVFVGYIVLLVGMSTVLGTRIAQRRSMPHPASTPGPKLVRKVAALSLGFALLPLIVPQNVRAAWPEPETLEKLRRLPVQHDGRVMPLDTVAREAVWNLTGQESWKGTDPVALVLGWTLDPDRWTNEPMVKLGSADLAREIGLAPQARYGTFASLVQNEALLRLVQQARDAEGRDEKLHGVLEDASKLEDRLMWMHGFVGGRLWRVRPQSSDPVEAWAALEHLHGLDDLTRLVDDPATATALPAERAAREILYNKVRPSRVAWIVLVVGMAASLAAWNGRRRWLDGVALASLAAGFAVMSWGIGIRWVVAGRIPAANMYESMTFLGWGVGFFALLAFLFIRNRLVVFNATAMSALTMALVDLLPIDGFIHPVAPVLAGTPWLAIHVPIIMVSYSVLALGVLIAHMRVGMEFTSRAGGELSAKLSDLLYWYTHIGSILLVAGIITGSIWAAGSWGRYWGWDPKEVWSLVAFLAYIAILHGRFDRFLGEFGVAVLSIAAFWTILMTYVGVNFVLASGLHSYGFGSSGVVNVMAGIAAAEVVFIGAASWMRARRRPADGGLATIS